MDKTKLVEALKNVDPARSDKNINKCFWLTGKSVLAFDSEMCISVPFVTEFTGGIQETILPLLDNHAGTSCDLESSKKDDEIMVKVGASKFKLATMGIDELEFKMPKMDDIPSFTVKDVPEFLFALRAVTRSLGNDVSEEEFKGVTFLAKGKTLHMFAYERMSMCHAQVAISGEMGFERVLIPTAVVNQILRLTDGLTEMELAIDEKQVMLKCPRARLWGHCGAQERHPRDFLAYTKELRSKLNHDPIAIDGENFRKLPGMIDRACIITQSAVEVTKTKITWIDGKMYFLSKSSRGVAEEVAKPGEGQQSDTVLNVDPEKMKRGLDLTRMGMTDTTVIFSNDDDTLHFFVSGA